MDDPLIGKQLGPCRIESVLGRGGIGVVYRAFHIPLDRPVALKVMSAELMARPGASETLLLEARSAARIDDPRVVQVYDVGQQDGVTYLIMQLVDGETLEQKIKREGPLKQDQALAIMKEAMLALRAAHELGVVHRDVKPANLLLPKAGGVKLMDFGIAASFNCDEKLKAASSAGSIEYMAPEQAFGWEPDPRADLYAFGVTYFQVLTGCVPYAGTPEEIAIKHREAPVPDVREKNREVTQAAAALIEKLMAKAPEARPAGADEVLKLMSAPGMLLNVDPSGSPFKLLPPPVEEKGGFVPPPEYVRDEKKEEVVPQKAAPAAGPTPAPPPALAYAVARPTAATWIIYLSLYFFFFGRPWLSLGHADWLGAAAAASVGACFFLARPRGMPAKFTACVLGAGTLLCLYRYGLGPGAPLAELRAAGMENGAIILFAAALAAGGLFLGIAEGASERALSLSLFAGSGLAMLAAAVALRHPAGTPWSAGLQILAFDARRLVDTGGAARWASLAVFCAGSALFIPERPNKSGPKKVVNWNS